jgi:LacI family transcriptional regulator
MSAPAPTVRSLARSLRLSRTTVSDALRSAGRVDPATVLRVQQAARAAGYQRNPLAAAVMSELRRSRSGTFRGVLAVVDLYEPDRSPHGVFHRELVHGASARAVTMGFKTEEFVVGRDGLTLQRLDSILQSRGIHGVFLLPAWNKPDWSALDWTHYAGIYTDYNIERPAMHCVCCDHYRSVMNALGRLAAQGYRRPGLILEAGRDERIHRRIGAAFRAFQSNHPDVERVPVFILPDSPREKFQAWFREFQPDVVLGHFTEAINWMEGTGARIPEDHGFVSLNHLYQARPCAGLDLQPRELGARGVELLIAQLQRNEFGLPECPTTTTLTARWIDGPTIRPAAAVRPRPVLV